MQLKFSFFSVKKDIEAYYYPKSRKISINLNADMFKTFSKLKYDDLKADILESMITSAIHHEVLHYCLNQDLTTIEQEEYIIDKLNDNFDYFRVNTLIENYIKHKIERFK